MKFRFQGTKGKLEKGKVHNIKVHTAKVEDTHNKYGNVLALGGYKSKYREVLRAETIGKDKDVHWQYDYYSLKAFNMDWKDASIDWSDDRW